MSGIRDERRGVSLIGARGTGKTTVGRLLAARLGLPFRDADAELETRAGRSIAAIFAAEGEGAFRELEESVVHELTSGPPIVLATGGGAILRQATRERLRAFGPVVWLSAPATILAQRIGRGEGRPSLTGRAPADEIAAVLAAREPLYRETAHHVVESAGSSAERIASLIAEVLAGEGAAR